MKLVVEYFNNNILLFDGSVFSLEIENKSYFYKFVNDLFLIKSGENVENIILFDSDKEIGLCNKINVLLDYFDFPNIFKNYNTNLIKYLSNVIDNDEKERSLFRFNRACSFVSNEINKVDLPFYLKCDFTFDTMLKTLKFDIVCKDNLLDNLFLLFDIEKELKSNQILFFINLKQYLKKDELVEVYKYAIYNNIKIILVDSQAYGGCLEFEHKLIIDEQLDEFMI